MHEGKYSELLFERQQAVGCTRFAHADPALVPFNFRGEIRVTALSDARTR